MNNAELIKALRWCGGESNEWCVREAYKCPLWNEDRITDECKAELMRAAADALEAANEKIADYTAAVEALDDSNDAYIKENERLRKRITELEDELRFQLDTRRKETAEIERLKAENLKLQKQNRDCGWNCKQCEHVDKDLQAEESEQRLMELDRRLYELRSFNAKMKGE